MTAKLTDSPPLEYMVYESMRAKGMAEVIKLLFRGLEQLT
jgi:hypothetical protein